MKVHKTIKVRKMGSVVSDKQHFDGQPFETIGSEYRTLDEAMKAAKEYNVSMAERLNGLIPYIVIGNWHNTVYQIHVHRWKAVNPFTNELVEA